MESAVFANSDLLAVASNLVAILQVIIAIGLVIFVHELGHFLAARWCGVHVKRFSIGFGPPIVRWISQKTGTEYWIAWFPLGGYVSMKGQDDIRPEQMTSEEMRADPTAYPGRPVWQRMIIISAGVVMNVIFGLLCFIIMYNMGPEYIPPQIGLVRPGGPAWQAGLQPGDRILAVNNRQLVKFKDLQTTVQLSDPSGDPLLVRFERNGSAHTVAIRPEQTELWPQIGIANPTSPVLARDWPIPPDSAAGKAGLRPGDRIIAVDGQPVTTGEQIKYLLAQKANQTVHVTVERPDENGRQNQENYVAVELQLPPQPFLELPVVLEMGPIAAVRKGSPGESAGLKAGDIIVTVNGEPVDPFRLPDVIRSLAGQEIELQVHRPGKGQAVEELVVRVVPLEDPTWLNEPIFPDSYLECPGLGIAYDVRPLVQEVRAASEETAAARAGDRITAIRIVPPEYAPADLLTDNWVEIAADARPSGLASAFWYLQQLPGASLDVRLDRDGKSLETRWKTEPAADWYLGTRALVFEPLIRRLPPLGLIGSVRQGWYETLNVLKVMYVGLERMLFRHTISPTSVRGPITIARVFYQQAKKSWTDYLFTLAIFSLNLAVLNFLPIPLLDGGHMVFLLWEAITRRPPSPKVQIALTYLGLLLVLFLMAWTLYLDIRDLF